MSNTAGGKSNRRRTIALLTSNASLGDNYQGALRRGVEQACEANDIELWVYAGRHNWTDEGDQHKLYNLVDPSRLDAIIIATGVLASYTSMKSAVRFIRNRCPVPLVAVGQYCDGQLNVLVDNKSGAMHLIEHLVREHNCREFAYVTGPDGHEESRQRLEGTKDALLRFGIQLSPEAIIPGDFSPLSGKRAGQQVLELKKQPDAVLAANDYMALGVLDTLQDAGLRCPEEIIVAGFDDSAGSRFSDPPLTTIRQPVARMGCSAVEFLVQILDGTQKNETVTLDTELIVRESCGCNPTALLTSVKELPSKGAALSPSIDEIQHLLISILEDVSSANRWANALVEAVQKEIDGKDGAFSHILGELLRSTTYPHLPIFGLQNVITHLYDFARRQHARTDIEAVFHTARILVGNHMYRRSGAQQLRNDELVGELGISWDRLSTVLSLPVLKETLLIELPRLGILNGIISLFESDTPGQLVPWVCLKNGEPLTLPTMPYPIERILPEQMLDAEERRSLTIMALTFESEQFGLVALELPFGIEAYALLREQIGSAVRTVRMHQKFLVRERLRIKAQEEQRLANERLRSLSVIAGGVAHDLNNVLGPVVALPDTLENELAQNASISPSVFDDLDIIRTASQRAAHTIQDLFLLGRTQEMPKQSIDLSRLLMKETGNLRTISKKKEIRVDVQTSDVKLVISGAKSHLIRVISNLVINAVQAIEDEGVVEVIASYRELHTPVEGFVTVPKGRYVIVEVRDTGRGIAPEHMSQLMEPFFTLNHGSDKSGSGLGLAIVWRIVKESDGYIDVHSAPGKGTTFTLYFPLVEEPSTESSGPPAPIVGGCERILVVDDEMVQLRTAKRILTQLGYTVETVSSGETAIALFETGAESSHFDLVIVDMLMPGLDGITTVERLRQIHADQKALIASGYAPEQMAKAAAERGLPWLAKPYTINELDNALRKALRGDFGE